MKVLVLNQSQVRQLLPMKECIDVMKTALKSLAQGNAELPLRQAMWFPDRVGLLGMMPAILFWLKKKVKSKIAIFWEK